jgi:hypothetical protein
MVLLWCLWYIAGAVFAQDATTGIVRGSVYDNSTPQNEIEGVTVVVVDVASNRYEAVTDANGEYEITGLSPGRYLMSFFKDDYEAREHKRLEIFAGSNHYAPVQMTKSEPPSKPPWLLLICLGGVAILICGLVIAVGFRIDRTSG